MLPSAVVLLVLGRPPPALTYTSSLMVMDELKEWAHSHFSDCLAEFNTTQPSSASCKLSEGANSVQGHNVILGLAVHGVPADKRDLGPPALVFCADRLHAAHKQELNRLFDKYATTGAVPPADGAVRGWSKLRSTTRTLYVSKLLNATAKSLAVAFPAELSPFVPLILGEMEQENFDEFFKRCEPDSLVHESSFRMWLFRSMFGAAIVSANTSSLERCALSLINSKWQISSIKRISNGYIAATRDANARSENSEENTSFSLGNSVLGLLQRHWFTLCYSLFLHRLVSRAWFLGE